MFSLIAKMFRRPPVAVIKTPSEAWIRRARAFDWLPAILARRISEMDGETARLIMEQPERYDTLSVRAAMEVTHTGKRPTPA